MSWSAQQEAALREVAEWLRSGRSQIFYLAGFAGTGKTTLAKALAADVDGDVVFGAFTGKAALVMRSKGCRGARTIHSLIYSVDDDEDQGDVKFKINRDSAVASAKLVIIDECSMIGEELGRDLLSFGTKVLVLGDPAQLPPVEGDGFFTSRKPDVMLTEVHRQARDNPIIRMSMDVREGRALAFGRYGSSLVIERKHLGQKMVRNADMVLVGKNATRQTFNQKIRLMRGFEGIKPVLGERLVCLRNNREKGLLNGGIWTVAEAPSSRVRRPVFKLRLQPEDARRAKPPLEVSVHSKFFEGTENELSWSERRKVDEFTYGHALTTHKSQGSQWDNVVVIDESSVFREKRKEWLYTAITRAAQSVIVVA